MVFRPAAGLAVAAVAAPPPGTCCVYLMFLASLLVLPVLRRVGPSVWREVSAEETPGYLAAAPVAVALGVDRAFRLRAVAFALAPLGFAVPLGDSAAAAAGGPCPPGYVNTLLLANSETYLAVEGTAAPLSDADAAADSGPHDAAGEAARRTPPRDALLRRAFALLRAAPAGMPRAGKCAAPSSAAPTAAAPALVAAAAVGPAV